MLQAEVGGAAELARKKEFRSQGTCSVTSY